MKLLSTGLIIIALALFSSCGVSHVTLTAQRDPQISLVQSGTNILVINRFDVGKVDFFLRKEKKKEVYNRGINTEIAQVLSELEQIKGIQLIKKSDSLTMARDLRANLDSTVLTIGEIQKLASMYKADYILALENYDASFVQDEVIKTKNSDGSSSKIAKYSLAIRSSWVLYDKMGNSFRELGGHAAKYHSQRSVISGLLAVGPALGSNTKFIQDVSAQAGSAVVDYFRPQVITLNRPVYTDKLLKSSVSAIKKGDYNLAREQLEILAKNSNETIAAKAYYNLAVLAELKGNKQSAADFATLSLQKMKNIYASMLLNNLKYSS